MAADDDQVGAFLEVERGGVSGAEHVLSLRSYSYESD